MKQPDKPWRLMPWMTNRVFVERFDRLWPAGAVLLLVILAIVLIVR